MDALTRIMTFLGDAVFAALAFFSPAGTLVILSAIIGVGMLVVWRYTSNQKAIADVRRKIAANLLATRLFKDNLAVTFRAQRQILWQALRLLGHSVRPTLMMSVPFVLVMAQIGLHYERSPAAIGRAIRVTATIKSGASWQGIADELQLPDGLTRDRNDPCRAEVLRTVDWRLTPNRAGTFVLGFGAGGDQVEIPLVTGTDFARLSSQRGGSFWGRLLYSAEASIPAASVFESIHVHYPTRTTPILGLNIHWLITLLVLSIVFALIFKPLLKVHL